MRCPLTTLVVLGMIPSLAVAQPEGEATLERARAEYEAMGYAASIQIARDALARGENSPEAVAALHELLGKALAIEGQEAEAKQHFRKLLSLRPGFQVEMGESPKIRKPLLEVRVDWGGKAALAIGHEPPGDSRSDRPLTLKVLVIGDHESMVQTIRVSYTLPGSSSKGGLEVAASRGDAVLMIPLPALGARPGTFKYYIEVLDKNHNALLRKGELNEPLTVRLVEKKVAAAVAEGAKGTPWYGRWWVWAIAGAVVVGATTAAVATTARPDSSKVGLEWEVSGAGN